MIREYVAVDIETTGLRAKEDKIIEIGAIKVVDGKEVAIFDTLVNPGRMIGERSTMVTGITDADVKDAPYIEEIIGEFVRFVGDAPLLGHNLMFDYSFLKRAAVNNKYTFDKTGIDTLKLARKYLEKLESKKLDYLCSYFDIEDENHHRALNDARAAYKLYEILCEKGADDEKCIKLEYKVKKESPITPKQKKFLGDLMERYNIEMDFEIDKISKNEASRRIDNILHGHGYIK